MKTSKSISTNQKGRNQMITTDYRVNKEINETILKSNGFNRYSTYKCYIYKDLIQFVIHINIEEKDWDYQVIDVCNESLYTPYYDREFGKNSIICELDKKIENIINEMIKSKIFIKNGDDHNSN